VYDRSPPDLLAEHDVTMDDTCDGEVQEWIRYMRREIMNVMRPHCEKQACIVDIVSVIFILNL